MKTAIAIYLAAFIMSIPNCANAFQEYDVDWTSNNSRESILRVTIDKCTTKFTVKNDELDKFTKNKEALSDALKKAIERAASGCKN